MSTSYKQTFQQIRSATDTDTANKFAQVLKVYNNSGNLELEGTITVKFLNGEIQSNVFPKSYGFQQLPTHGELVEITKDDFNGRYFYAPAINVHNYPTHNSPNKSVVTTPNFIEPSTINPYKTFTGDTILQGRFGQSLRFTQTLPDTNTQWSTGQKQGSSVILLSSGQLPTVDGADLLEEDLDQDPAILVLQENGKLSYQGVDEYEGDQAYLASNRITLNAREDVINLTAQDSLIRLSPGTLNVETSTSEIASETFTADGNTFSLNYERISLGENAVNPLIKSPDLLADLATLTAQLTALSTALTGVTVVLAALPGGQAPAAALQTASTNVITQANNISTKVASGTYLSTKAFTE